MISTFDRRLWILLLIILIQCIITTKQQNIIPQKSTHQQQQKPAARWSQTTKARVDESFVEGPKPPSLASSAAVEVAASAAAEEADTNTQRSQGDNNRHDNNSNNNHHKHVANYKSNLLLNAPYKNSSSNNNQLKTKIFNLEKCAKNIRNPYNCLKSKGSSTILGRAQQLSSPSNITRKTTSSATTTIRKPTTTTTTTTAATFQLQQQLQPSKELLRHQFPKEEPNNQYNNTNKKPSQMPSMSEQQTSQKINPAKQQNEHQQQQHTKATTQQQQHQQQWHEHHREHQKVHIAHRQQHKETKNLPAQFSDVYEKAATRTKHSLNALNSEAQQAFRARRDLDEDARSSNELVEESRSSNEDSRNKKTLQRFREDGNARNLRVSQDNDVAAEAKQPSSSHEDEEASTSGPASAVAAAKEAVVAYEGSDDGSPASDAASLSAAAQLNAADALLFVSQDISGSVEDLLPSQMTPRELLLLPTSYYNESDSTPNTTTQNLSTVEHAKESAVSVAAKRTRSASVAAAVAAHQPSIKKHEPFIIIDDAEEFDSGTDRLSDDKNDDYAQDEPRVLALRPLLPSPYDDVHAEEMSVVYAEQHTEIRLMCEVDLDIATSVWYKNGLVVHAMDRTSRVTDYRFIKETNGALTITNVMLEDDGKWQCEAENTRAYVENARPVKLVVLDRPKPPYLLIDSRRLDAGNIFVPVKENSELNLACISEGGNPKPTLTWEVLLSPGVDRHAQKVSAEVLELQEVKSEKDKQPYKINGGAKSEARLPAVYRAHHNARILCVMEHPTLKIRQNASLLLDVQYTPSFAISRTPGFGYPLREGIEVSLKCDVDSNPPSTPRWQKDDGDTPVPQTGDGFLNFSSIRREHSGWYKCTSRHLNFQYSSIGYYLSVRYDSVDVTSEPDDQDISVAAASHNPNKGQLEVQLGGAVTLQCPQGSLGCWSHLDPVTARLRGLGQGLSTPTGQFSLKDVVYQDAGTYKCIGQSATNKKKLEVLQTVGVAVKGAPTVMARNATPVAYPGSPLHLSVEFCANPPAHAARWLHGDRVFTPGNQYGSTVLAYGVTDLPTPYCKEARLTYVSMHERVPRTFYFIVSSPGGVAEAMFKANFTMRYRTMSNTIEDEEEELSEPEEIHFPVFGSGGCSAVPQWLSPQSRGSAVLLLLLLLRWTSNRSTHL